MPVIEVNGATIDYGDTGYPGTEDHAEKPVVVLIHGWLGTWDNEFGPEIEWLKPYYRVLAPTRRGYGRSGPKPRTYGRDFYRRDAEDVAAWLDALDVKQAHIVGYSDGGEVAILMPIIRPDLVKTVTAWGAVGFFTPDLRARIRSKWPPTWIEDDVRALHGPEYVDQMVQDWVDSMLAIIDSGGNVSFSEAQKITCPFLLMLGKDDALNPEHLGRMLVNRTPNGRLMMFDCGHPVHREQPDPFRAALWAHLQAADKESNR